MALPQQAIHLNGDDVGEEENREVSPEDGAAPSRIPKPNRMPKKGILKRSTSFGSRQDNESGDTIFPLRVDRHSAEREPAPTSSKPSRIPKLSVTWWETNSVCGESPESRRRDGRTRSVDEEEEEDDDEEESVGSSAGSSQIAGTWWFGRSTRYVPHCERRGHHHHHGDGHECGEYLTPTQRKNRELIELKKQLRTALSQIDDKERHLAQLRERLNELESMMDATTVVSDTHKLMARQKELNAQFEAEKRALTDKYEQRVRQLRQEAADARAEAVKAVLLAEQRAVAERPPTVHAAVMTDQSFGDDAAGTIPRSDLDRTVDMYQQECRALRARIAELQVFMEQQQQQNQQQSHGGQIVAEQQFTNACLGAQCVAQRQEMHAQLYAHQNEALAWRTKAAELEIIVKQRLMANDPVLLGMLNGSMSPTPPDSADAERYRQECLRLQGYINQLEIERGNREMVDSGIEAQAGPPAQSLVGDCIMAQCVARRRKLSEDNEHLTERFAEAQTRLCELEEDLMEARRADAEMDSNLKRLEKRVADVLQQLQSKMAECEAAQLGVQRCQTDNATLRKAVDYLEERNQLLQNTLLDAGLIVHGESAPTYRKGFSDPRSRVDLSKKVQTELTSESLGNHEKEFLSLSEKMEHLEKEFSSERTDLRGRFKEIQDNLSLKAQLVQTLTKQLQASSADFEAAAESAERERQDYARKLSEISLIAQRVPLLEAELDRAHQERMDAERAVHVEREQYQEALESSLSGSLKQQQNHAQYWQQKLGVVERQHEADKIELKKLQKQYNEVKMRLNMEKVDLEQKLEGTIHQVATLTDKVYRPMDNKEVMAKPDVVNKYVACRPILKDKTSEIIKGELFDETDERLKLCQGELLTTRRQVEVLQQKLLDCVQVKEQHREDGTLLKKAHVLETELKQEQRKSEEALKKLVETNAQLEARIRQIEDEKTAIVWAERDKIAQLAAEFDNVRQELDTEIRKYEAEKRRMKDKVVKLESAVKDRDQLRTRLKRFEAYEQLLVDGPQPLDMRAVENELEMIKQSAQVVLVEPQEEDSTSLPVTKKTSTGSASRDPCVQFLLARLQSERQKYTEDTDFLRRKMAETKTECDRLLAVEVNGDVRRPSRQLERTSSDPLLLAAPATEGGDDTKAQLRAKNLLLIKDNTKLASELADVRRTVASSINRTASRRSTVGSLDVQSQAQSSIRSDRSPGFADLASDLNEVRVDLEGILQQIDNATVHQTSAQFAVAAAEKSREGRLMQWLEKELEEDKHELDVMTKWYAQDKRRMEADLKLSREDRAALQAQLDRLAVDYHDVCRELELYKQEDANRGRLMASTTAPDSSAVPFDGRLVRSHSSTDIAGGVIDREEHVRWKHKAGTMFRELGRLRRDYKTVDAELRNAQQQVIYLRGEVELARAGVGLFHTPTASDDMLSTVSAPADTPDSAVHDSPAKMTERERDLVLRVERVTSHNRALEMDSDRLRDELRQATANHEMTKGDLHAAQLQLRALDAQLAAHAHQQRSVPKVVSGDNNTLQVVGRQKRRSETASDTTVDSDVMRCSSTATFATATMASSLSLAKIGRLALSDPDISFRTASSPNLTSGSLSHRPSIVERLALAEERANHCEQEYEMAHTELLLLRDATQRQLSALRAERNELKKRLHEAICDAEKMGGPSGWDRVEELSSENDDLRAEVDRMTNERQDMYLIMFNKGQDAAKHEMEMAADRQNRRGSTPSSSYSGPLKTEQLEERIGQRQGLTEDEVVLRFLRDAVYYFLLNRDSKDHLQAIMSILKFSSKQRDDVSRKRGGLH